MVEGVRVGEGGGGREAGGEGVADNRRTEQTRRRRREHSRLGPRLVAVQTDFSLWFTACLGHSVAQLAPNRLVPPPRPAPRFPA